MRFDRKFCSALLAIAMVMSMLLPVSAAQTEATYGEASYYDIAVEAYSRMLLFHDGVVGAANQSRKYGLITSTGEVRVDFQYDGIWYLADNMFSVEQGGRYGIINSQGTVLEPVTHYEVRLVHKGEYEAHGVLNDDYIRIDGNFFTPDQSLTPVPDDEAITRYDSDMRELAERLGYDWIYHVGWADENFFIAYKYTSNGGMEYYLDGDDSYRVLLSSDWIQYYHGAETRVVTSNGIYDKYGALIYDASAHGQRILNEELSVVVEDTSNSLKGLIDLDGNQLIPCQYEQFGNKNREGYIGAVKDNGNGFVDSDIYRLNGSNASLVNTIANTRVATEVYYRHMAFSTSEDGLNGMMDVNGNILIPEEYTYIQADNNNNLLAQKGESYYDATYGLYDQDGRVIFRDGYESIERISNKLYKLLDHGRYGIMNVNGQTTAPFDYMDMRVHTESFIEVYDGSRYKIIDVDNETVVRESNQRIHLFRPLRINLGDELSHIDSPHTVLPFCIKTDEGYATVYTDVYARKTGVELAHRTSNFDLSDPSAMFAYQDDTTGLFGFGKLGEKDDESNILASGECGAQGDNLTWVLTSDGTLTISGTGEMADYDYVDVPVEGTDYSSPWPLTPWKEYLSSIKKVSIKEGATSIGDWAFAHCEEATDIIIPNSVITIGHSALLDCDSLTNLVLPDNITSIDGSAFINCSKLEHITLPADLARISHHIFAECRNLTSITIRQNIATIEANAFLYCNKLSDVYYVGSESQWSEIAIDKLGNDPLLNATIHFNSTGPDDVKMEELDPTVKYVSYYYAVGELSSGVSYEVVSGRLPSGLNLDESSGEIHGAPTVSGTFEFTIAQTGGEVKQEQTYKLVIQDNSNSAVQRPNDYEIIENVGDRDPKDPNGFYMTEYREEVFAIDGPYEEFYRLLIDGREKIKDVDYTVREGSTIITVRAQTFRDVGEGTHTIAAEFRGKDSQGKTTVKQVAQNYTLTINRPGDNTGNFGSSSNSGTSGSSSTNYSITVPKIPNCTVKVTPTSASAGTRVTLTVKLNTGYLLDSVTVTGPNGAQIALTQAGDGKYTFRMPDGKVNISAQVTAKEPDPVPAGDTPFVDIKETDWFYSAVRMAYQRGWMVGVSTSTFAPQEETSRGMIVSVLHRIAGQPAASNTYFADVPLNQYYTTAAAWAAEQGIVTGYGDGRFGPSDSLTREQIVMILYNYASKTGMDTTARSEMTQFTDLDQMSAGARTAMSWAHAVGLISGVGNNTLDPVGTATRAEMAAFLARFTILTEGN